MPRILRIINRLNLGGPAFNAAYLTKYLEPEFETLLVSGMKDETEESSEFIVNNLGLQPVYIPDMHRELHPILDLKSYWILKDIIKEFKPDIVHTHAAKAGAVGRLAALHCNVPIIVHTFHGHVFHSYFGRAKTNMFLHIERYLASRTTKIIALSTIQKKELCLCYKIAPSDKIAIIPLGFDLARFETDQEAKRKEFRRKYNLDDDEVAIGIIGRLVPIKNHSMFLKVIKRVSEITKKKIRAYIIGDGEERSKIEETAIALGLKFSNEDTREKNILTFTSWIKEVDVCNAGLDIIVLTSDNEGTPVSLIEAQAAGKPIVATNVGGIMDILVKNDTVLIAEKGDEKSFSDYLLQLILKLDQVREHSQEGRNFVNRNFAYPKLCANTITLYRTLLNNLSERGF
jgi:glycosyltransferase involved in cell wall biosynthesis